MMLRLHRQFAARLSVTVLTGFLGAAPAAAQGRLNAGLTVGELGVGDVNADVVFTPVTPCRLIDTREPGQTRFNANEVRRYNLIGPSNYSSLGGNPAGCNIPNSTTLVTPAAGVTPATFGNTVRALVLSFAATEVGGRGSLRAWPANIMTAPLAAVLTYDVNLYAVANGVVVASCNSAAAAGDPCPLGDVAIQADTSHTHLVVDVLGYYTPQRFTLAPNRTLTGVFAVDFKAAAGGDGSSTAFSFHPPLPSAPTPNLIPVGGPPTANCPGSNANPTAAPGHLCLYLTLQANVNGADTCILSQLGPGPWTCNAADPIGASYYVASVAVGRAYSVGVWAVTAP